MGRHELYRTFQSSTYSGIINSAGSIWGLERGLHALIRFCDDYALILRAVAAKGMSPGRSTHLRRARQRLVFQEDRALRQLLGVSYLWDGALRLLLEIPEEQYEYVATRAGRLAAGARAEARDTACARRSERCQGYRAWVDEELRTGAAALHGLCRERPLEPDTAVSAGLPSGRAGWSLQPTDLLIRERHAWCQVWHRHMGAKAPWREGNLQPIGEALPPLTPAILREAARQFPARKGYSGCCARWFLYLEDSALEGVCRFLETCERTGLWPEAVKHAMLHLIPKRGGGQAADRPRRRPVPPLGEGAGPTGEPGGLHTRGAMTTEAKAVVQLTRCGPKACTTRRRRLPEKPRPQCW